MAKRSGRAEPPRAVPNIEVFVENLPGNVYRRVRRPDGSYVFEYLSSGLFRQFDIDNERLLAQDPVRFDWIHPDDHARFVADLEISAATLGLLDHRIRVIGQDGRVHWARGIARPSRRPDGSVVWDGIVIDVTRETEAEAALRVAKDEADRAHATAARMVADAVARLEEPVRQLGGQLSALADGGGVDASALAQLRTCQIRLQAALGDLSDKGGLARRGAEPSLRRVPELTPRQEQVLSLAGAGLSNKAISQRLGITPGTVKLHVAAVLRAVGAQTRRQLREIKGT